MKQASTNNADITAGATGLTGAGNPHNHGDTGESSFTWKPKYVNAILGRKN
jgi:hypothetical protein